MDRKKKIKAGMGRWSYGNDKANKKLLLLYKKMEELNTFFDRQKKVKKTKK